jgi:deazaflavin-dependent oxidoreductase (nitroreductase family)
VAWDFGPGPPARLVFATVAPMGLATELGFTERPINAMQRAVQAVASTRPGAWVFSKTVTPVDRFVFRLSKGRYTVPELLAGLPVIMVTTTGRRSGQARTMPLVGVPTGDDLAIVGTNFGQAPTPAWAFNLEADPTATVTFHDRAAAARARPATDLERTAIFAAAAVIYPGYDKYQERITDRTIRIFVLEPTS